MTWTCHTCDAEFATFGRAQTHANEAHHGGRIAIAVPSRRVR